MSKIEQANFSLATLLMVTTCAAIGFLALIQAGWLWTRCVFFVALIILLSSLICVCFFRGSRRAFWIGFAIFGWAHFLIFNLPMLQVAEFNMLERELIEVWSAMAQSGNDGVVINVSGARIAVFSFNRIVVSLMGLVFATLGGVIGLRVYQSEESRLAKSAQSESLESPRQAGLEDRINE